MAKLNFNVSLLHLQQMSFKTAENANFGRLSKNDFVVVMVTSI